MRMYLVLGDWSDDGHGKYKKILVEVNKDVTEVQNAYKNSCKLTGISFNHNEDFTEIDRDWKEAHKYRIASEYEQPELTDEVKEVLTKFECPSNILNDYIEEIEHDSFVNLWFWFVSLSLPNIKHEIIKIKDDIPTINGYWDKNLNVQFGYALFM